MTGARRRMMSPEKNKAAFIRSLPEGMSASEIVDRARQQGMMLTPGYIYKVRSIARSGNDRQRPLDESGNGGATGAGLTGTAEAQLVQLVLYLGLHRTEELLNRLRSNPQSLGIG
jgi:hypothetical protein